MRPAARRCPRPPGRRHPAREPPASRGRCSALADPSPTFFHTRWSAPANRAVGTYGRRHRCNTGRPGRQRAVEGRRRGFYVWGTPAGSQKSERLSLVDCRVGTDPRVARGGPPWVHVWIIGMAAGREEAAVGCDGPSRHTTRADRPSSLDPRRGDPFTTSPRPCATPTVQATVPSCRAVQVAEAVLVPSWHGFRKRPTYPE